MTNYEISCLPTFPKKKRDSRQTYLVNIIARQVSRTTYEYRLIYGKDGFYNNDSGLQDIFGYEYAGDKFNNLFDYSDLIELPYNAEPEYDYYGQDEDEDEYYLQKWIENNRLCTKKELLDLLSGYKEIQNIAFLIVRKQSGKLELYRHLFNFVKKVDFSKWLNNYEAKYVKPLTEYI